MPIQVLYLIDNLMALGGGEGALLRIVGHLPRERFQCAVATFRVSESTFCHDKFPCPLHVFPMRRTYDFGGIKAAFQVRKLILEKKIDIVHTFFETSNVWGGLITKLSSGRPILITSRRDMGILRERKHRLGYWFVNRLCEGTVAVSEEVRRHCIEQEGVRPEKITTIRNGIDLDAIDSARDEESLREKLNLAGASHTITTVANIRRVKGLDIFLRAAALVSERFPNAKYVILGGESEPDHVLELKQLARTLGIEHNVVFAGRVEPAYAVLRLTDVFCMLSRSEGFSNALLESMAMSLPCVATAVGGNPEAIRNGCDGLLVENEDYQAAAKRILELLENPDLRQRIGSAARKTVESNFTVDKMVTEYASLYTQLLERHRPSVEARSNVVQRASVRPGSFLRRL